MTFMTAEQMLEEESKMTRAGSFADLFAVGRHAGDKRAHDVEADAQENTKREGPDPELLYFFDAE